MRLADLHPIWLMRDGAKAGFIFLSPTDPNYWQSCMFAVFTFREQCAMFVEALHSAEEWPGNVQPCKQFAWTPESPLEFDVLTVSPSIDGSAGGLWHGYIRNGEIVNV